MTLLEAERISVDLGGRTVVKQVSLRAAAGQLLALIGPNGAGKTTLLAALAGLRRFRGGVRLQGRPLATLGRRERARALAYLPQGHIAHWPLTVRRLVELGRLPHLAPWRPPAAADRLAVEEAMQRTDIADLAERPFDTLSGGERARVMLARVLAVEAPLVLADEPVASLDPYHQLRVMELLRDYADSGAALVVVLHDLTLAARFCDELLLLREGSLVARGSADGVLSAAHLAEAYRVTALRGEHEDQRYVLPWRRLAAEESGEA
ncbi:MAG: ABC transporter ATP-binding protein [Candidatus Competibacteraceae bacterium]|nr:MAG: ABC transporter ATP-binding protein [Candidatus Competibacteraceae bacterium]